MDKGEKGEPLRDLNDNDASLASQPAAMVQWWGKIYF